MSSSPTTTTPSSDTSPNNENNNGTTNMTTTTSQQQSSSQQQQQQQQEGNGSTTATNTTHGSSTNNIGNNDTSSNITKKRKRGQITGNTNGNNNQNQNHNNSSSSSATTTDDTPLPASKKSRKTPLPNTMNARKMASAASSGKKKNKSSSSVSSRRRGRRSHSTATLPTATAAENENEEEKSSTTTTTPSTTPQPGTFKILSLASLVKSIIMIKHLYQNGASATLGFTASSSGQEQDDDAGIVAAGTGASSSSTSSSSMVQISRLDHFCHAIIKQKPFYTMKSLLQDLQILEKLQVINVVQLVSPKRENRRLSVVHVNLIRRDLPVQKDSEIPSKASLKDTVLYHALNDPIEVEELHSGGNKQRVMTEADRRKELLRALTRPSSRAANATKSHQQQLKSASGDKTGVTPIHTTATSSSNKNTSTPTSPRSVTTPVSTPERVTERPLHGTLSPHVKRKTSRSPDLLTALDTKNFKLFQYYKELEDACLHVLLAFQSISQSGVNMATRLPLVELLQQIVSSHEDRPSKQKILKCVIYLANEAPEFLSLFYQDKKGVCHQICGTCKLKEEASLSSLLQRPLSELHIIVHQNGSAKGDQVNNNKKDGEEGSSNGDGSTTAGDDAATKEPSGKAVSSASAAPLVLRPQHLVTQIHPKLFQKTQLMLRNKKEESRAKSHLTPEA